LGYGEGRGSSGLERSVEKTTLGVYGGSDGSAMNTWRRGLGSGRGGGEPGYGEVGGGSGGGQPGNGRLVRVKSLGIYRGTDRSSASTVAWRAGDDGGGGGGDGEDSGLERSMFSKSFLMVVSVSRILDTGVVVPLRTTYAYVPFLRRKW
jgi:hypothetical protein